MTSPTSALHGVRVLELTSSASGQSAGMLLADLGADVVRVVAGVGSEADDVERVGRPAWLCWNRGKSVIATDEPIEPLLGRADILLHDSRPSETAAAALDADSLRRRHPPLISVWLPPVSAQGRWCELPHDHLLLDAIGGFAAHHPSVEDVPVAAVVPTRFLVQGALAAVAALAALYARNRDGWGRTATVGGLHAEAATLNTLVNRAVAGSAIVAPGKLLPGGPNFRLYQASGGQWLYLAALSPELFIKALDVLDRLEVFAHPDVAGDFINIMRPEVGRIVGAELDVAFAQATADRLVHNPPEPGPCASFLSGSLTDFWCDDSPRPTPPTVDPPSDGDRPLGDLRVLDASTFLAGPFISTLLAVHGADVVKVESPTGDPYAVFTAPYSNINEHKSRLTLDLRDDGDRRRFLELVSVADVVIDNLIASSLARLQLGPDRFEAANPSVIRCSLTAFGAEGPFAELPGFDPIMQTLSGLVAIQGGAGRPVHTAAPVHDIATGCLGAVSALAALLVRQRDGHGQRTFVSLAATSTYLQSGELTAYAGRPARPSGGPDFAGPSPWQRYYRAADRWLAVSATTAAQRDALISAVGLGAELHSITGLEGHIEARIAARSCHEWVSALAAAGVPACAAINCVELDDPFLIENRYSKVIETPVGRLEVVNGYTDWHHTERRPAIPLNQLAGDRPAVLERWTTGVAAKG